MCLYLGLFCGYVEFENAQKSLCGKQIDHHSFRSRAAKTWSKKRLRSLFVQKCCSYPYFCCSWTPVVCTLIFQIIFWAPTMFHVQWKVLGRDGKLDGVPACSQLKFCTPFIFSVFGHCRGSHLERCTPPPPTPQPRTLCHGRPGWRKLTLGNLGCHWL